jgi:hypothetical protein
MKQLWMEFLFWAGILDELEWCSSCRQEHKAFDDDCGSPDGLCGGCGSGKAEARAEMLEDR